MDTAGLLRAQKAAAKSQAIADSLQNTTTNANADDNDNDGIPGGAPVSPSQRRRGGGNEGGSGDTAAGGDKDGDGAAVLPVVAPSEVRSVAAAVRLGEEGLLGEAGQGEAEEEGEAALEPSASASAPGLEMLPMGAVAHLSRQDRLGIIRKTVPKERRMVVLQRLFHLAQGGCGAGLVGRCSSVVLIVHRDGNTQELRQCQS